LEGTIAVLAAIAQTMADVRVRAVNKDMCRQAGFACAIAAVDWVYNRIPLILGLVYPPGELKVVTLSY
jgi:hypothetical protein